MRSVLREFILCIGAIGATLFVQYLFNRRKLQGKKRKRRGTADVQETNLRPPFPQPVVDLLQSACLCHLGVTLDDGKTHLCLMNFTYVKEEETLILTTRRNTTKYQAIEKIDLVTLLIHDFPTDKSARSVDSGYAKTHSITLYGNASILSGEDAEEMRLKHLQRHGDKYSQFIIGKDIAVLKVEVSSAKLCNIKDEVTMWDAACPNKS
jgi:nitroimidazol reductase NimA-like FMN-containing flavoprotein (pyridoxamine 5'-phosphate oxidase superfamily)